ncbi:MAG: hypothetical protein WC785_08485 [Tatlockia sp.]|jgi:hypothetical protein
MNQNCAELMLIKANLLVCGKKIQFKYENAKDVQVDLSEIFLYTRQENYLWTSGYRKESLEADLALLKKQKVYFLRTGTNNGAGHWQTLYFNGKTKGWVCYSSPKNNFQLTQGDRLIDERLLVPKKELWGETGGKYAFFLAEATKENLANATHFLSDFRTLGEERARLNLAQKTEKILTPAQFNPLFTALKKKTDALVMNQSKRYQAASEAAKQLIAKLEDKNAVYFVNGNFNATLFKSECQGTVDAAEEAFKPHRGWHRLPSVLKGFIGILAGLTIILPVVIEAGSKQGYWATFFETPETDSAQKLQHFIAGMDAP